MRLTVAAVGRRMPDWVQAGAEEYARRLPARWRFTVREVAQATGGDVVTRTAREGEMLLGTVGLASGRSRSGRGTGGEAGGDRGGHGSSYLVALDERGRAHDTRALAGRLERWQGLGRDVALLVGGADGLHADVLARADESWSLSPLTFPHPLVRVILIEQLYRAHSLLSGHPYHRA